MRTKITLAALAGLAGLTFAADTCNQVAGKQISGLAVYAPDVSKGPKLGQSFDIKWEPTGTYTTVSILLLKGPSTNVVPHGCIINNIPNSGSYTWQVPSDLPAQSTGYGIQIIADGTGDFQYSSQFGISKGSSSGGPSTNSNGDVLITSTTLVSGHELTTTIYHQETSTTSCSTTSSSSAHVHPTIASHKIVHTHHKNATYTPHPTAQASSKAQNVTESVSPTVALSVPSSLVVGGSGHEITSQPSAAASSSAAPAPTTTQAKAAAPRITGAGVVAVMGALAALVL